MEYGDPYSDNARITKFFPPSPGKKKKTLWLFRLPVSDKTASSILQTLIDLQNFSFTQAICTEAGLMALRERRMKVTNEDFRKSKENVLYRKNEGTPEGLYL